jgi:hypothetical protein
MKQVLSIKSMLFYGIMIVSVVVLFSVTTSYGETYLKAAKLIAGRYKFVDSECLNGITLRLDQSGRYLTAAIVFPDRPIPDPPSLSGTWSGSVKDGASVPLLLRGKIPNISSCYPAQQVWFQGTLEQQIFSGQLIFANGTRVPFRSQLESKPIESNKQNPK